MKTFEEVAEELGWNLDEKEYLITLAREFFEAGVREGRLAASGHKVPGKQGTTYTIPKGRQTTGWVETCWGLPSMHSANTAGYVEVKKGRKEKVEHGTG